MDRVFIYINLSRSTVLFSESDLIDLLHTARQNNAKRDITGILLFDGTCNFIQVLEGPKEQVFDLFDIIKQDGRHADVYQLGCRDVTQRTFESWQMGFKNLSDIKTASLPEFCAFLNNDSQTTWSEADKSFAVQMLKYFKEEYTAQ